jgi:hypothetical protein
MPTLKLNDEQVVELVRQLPKAARGEALRALLADPEWDAMMAYGGARLADALVTRGLDPAAMSPDQIEQAINDIAEGR